MVMPQHILIQTRASTKQKFLRIYVYAKLPWNQSYVLNFLPCDYVDTGILFDGNVNSSNHFPSKSIFLSGLNFGLVKEEYMHRGVMMVRNPIVIIFIWLNASQFTFTGLLMFPDSDF